MATIGIIVKSFGYQYIVECEGKLFQAVTKSKKTEYVVGDLVELDLLNQEQAQITNLVPRKNLVYRSDKNRSKLIASNITNLLIIIAVKPNFNPDFLNNCLIFAESSKIHPTIIINKADLPQSQAFIEEITQLYHDTLGYSLITISAINSCKELTSLLHNQQNLLIGQSGVGKSTITHSLTLNHDIRIGNLTISEKSGSHTTTNASLYHLDPTTNLIDCPGLHEFGLYHLNLDELDSYFPEFQVLNLQCKFRNCRHLKEPGCGVIEAYQNKLIDPTRFRILNTLTTKLLNKTHY